MYSYSLVSIAVVIFGFVFLINSKYEKLAGHSTRAILAFITGTYIAGFTVLFIVNKFRLEITPFSMLVAFVAAVNVIIYNFCSINSLGKINLSLFSVFAMLGGMALPFVAGLLFFDEKLTLGKIICFVTIAAALAFTIEKDKKKGGLLYYAGVFVFNGMSGVISKFYTAADVPNKASEAAYSAQIAIFAIVICLILLAFNKDEKLNLSFKSVACIASNGALGNTANLLLLLGLAKLPASAQYPFVTGGTMIVSTIICFFTPNKPKKREIIAVALSFAGIMALCLLDK